MLDRIYGAVMCADNPGQLGEGDAATKAALARAEEARQAANRAAAARKQGGAKQ
ncbi:hypothetical protein ACFRKB_32255 [Streptomyces scopuliridis]|uniref:hypothetical protein n=1 Tax=Streptomyces scopuliridis TaxID=452529 RepID=UPI0036B42BE4